MEKYFDAIKAKSSDNGEIYMWDMIWFSLNNPSFWQGTVAGLILYKLLAKAVSHILDKIRTLLHTRKESIEFCIEDLDSDLTNYVKFGYLLVRFGTDEFLKETATDSERKDAILQNEEIFGKSHYDRNQKLFCITLPIKIHKTLGVQFKPFVDVLDSTKLNDVMELLQKNEKFDDVKISGSLNKQRIYFLLRSISETMTPEGIRNNYIYPK